MGILGGTFDPIHYGHLRIAQEVMEAIGLSEVRFIPAATPPHKRTPTASAEQRTAMVKLAIQDNPAFSLDLIELSRSGPSYTIDTLEHLYHLHPETACCLILGSDAFRQLYTWHRWQALLDFCHIILVQRPPAENTTLCPEMEQFLTQHATSSVEPLSRHRHGLIYTQSVTAQDISSSQIRQLIANKLSTQYLTPVTVVDYIDQHKLYC